MSDTIQPPGYLSPDQLAAIRQRWDRRYKNNGKPAACVDVGNLLKFVAWLRPGPEFELTGGGLFERAAEDGGC